MNRLEEMLDRQAEVMAKQMVDTMSRVNVPIEDALQLLEEFLRRVKVALLRELEDRKEGWLQ